MAKLLKDHNLRQKYGAQLRKRIERDYNEHQALSSYRDLYTRNFNKAVEQESRLFA